MPYFKKSELFTSPADKHNVTGQFNPSVHGFNGLVGVSLPGFPTPIDNKVIEATQQLGGEFKFNLDMNSGNELGVGECLVMNSTSWTDRDMFLRMGSRNSQRWRKE